MQVGITRTCKALGIQTEAVRDFAFSSIVLGATVGTEASTFEEMANRLVYSGKQVPFDEIANTAVEIELERHAMPGTEDADRDTIIRRLDIVFGAANGMRRVAGGRAARTLLRNIRKKLSVERVPRWDFENKGYILYQEGFIYWLNNSVITALKLFERSAKADERWAKETGSRFHKAKAAMSRVVGARIVVETLTTVAKGPANPDPDPEELEKQAKILAATWTTISDVRSRITDGKQIGMCDRFERNAVLHLAQTRAWLNDQCQGEWPGGNHKYTVEELLAMVQTGRLGLEEDTGILLAASLARANLAFRQGRYQTVIERLADSPEIMLNRKAGETAGLRGQLLAIANRDLDNRDEFIRWCRWLATECNRDAGNGPAIEWSKANLAEA